MKRELIGIAVLMMAVACQRDGAASRAGSQTTATIAPATAPPTQNGTDAMTQTTEVEDSRSEADGGVSSPASGTSSTKTTKTTTSTAKPAAKKKPK